MLHKGPRNKRSCWYYVWWCDSSSQRDGQGASVRKEEGILTRDSYFTKRLVQSEEYDIYKWMCSVCQLNGFWGWRNDRSTYPKWCDSFCQNQHPSTPHDSRNNKQLLRQNPKPSQPRKICWRLIRRRGSFGRGQLLSSRYWYWYWRFCQNPCQLLRNLWVQVRMEMRIIQRYTCSFKNSCCGSRWCRNQVSCRSFWLKSWRSCCDSRSTLF